MTVLPSTAIEFDLSTPAFKKIELDDLVLQETEPHKVYWIHVNLAAPSDLARIAKKINLPNHILEWCRAENILPKFLEDDDEVSIRIETVTNTEITSPDQEIFDDLVIYLTEHYCFTAARTPLPALLALMDHFPKSLKYAKTSCFILFLIFDEIINDYSKVLLYFEIAAEDFDGSMLQEESAYNKVMELKKRLMTTKRNAVAIRHMLMQTSARKISVISDECRTSLEQLFNHMQVVVNEADAIHDLQNGLLDQLHNALIQKMNQTMMVLTAFASIFLPLTFIAGVYGMNFKWMPELQWHYGYFWALGLMSMCGFGLLWIFKRRKWF